MATLDRAPILLEPEQHEALRGLAQVEGRSVSEVVREILRQYVAEVEQEAQAQRELDALEDLTGMRRRLCEERGMYQGELIEEIRAEREEETARMWRGDA